MRPYFLSIVFASIVASSAFSADKAVYKAKPAKFAPAQTWTGPYVGGHLGYGEAGYRGIFDSSELPAFPEQAGFLEHLNLSGFAAGLHAGYNWQSGVYVFGIEGDATLTDWNDHVDDAAGGGTDAIEGKIGYLATLRARIGIEHAGSLAYVTGGLAASNARYTAIDDDSFAASVSFNDVGFVYGGGVEYRIGRNWSVRAEGLYYSFDDRRDASALTGDSDPGDFAEFDDAWLVRGGISFHY